MLGQPAHGRVRARRSGAAARRSCRAAPRRSPTGVERRGRARPRGQELHLLAADDDARGEEGGGETVLVVDDVTPLMRAQKVAAWRDVARRLAHEIKNPLTPIQLSAERLRRHFSQAAGPTRQLVDECSTTIVAEVESLKSLVDEFSQFARMPAPRAVPTDVNALLDDALSLYRRAARHVRIVPRLACRLPLVRLDPEQFRRVIINLVDNAIEAMTGEREAGLASDIPGEIIVETASMSPTGSSACGGRQRPGLPEAIGASCSCRTIRPSAAAAASASPSSDASSSSTAAASRRATTIHAARALRSSCRCESAIGRAEARPSCGFIGSIRQPQEGAASAARSGPWAIGVGMQSHA